MDVSVNFSLGFFFLHFQGLKMRPILDNLPLRLLGGVLPLEFSSSPRVALCCRSASSSAGARHEEDSAEQQQVVNQRGNPIITGL